MIIRTDIPQETLPINLDVPNALRIFHRSNLLFPAVGPVASIRITQQIKFVLSHLVLAGKVLRATADYNKIYGPLKLEDHKPAVSIDRSNLDQYTQLFRQRVTQQIGQVDATINKVTMRYASDSMVWGNGDTQKFTDKEAVANLKGNEQELIDAQTVLRGLSISNLVMKHLFDSKLIAQKVPISIDRGLVSSANMPVIIVASLAKKFGESVTEKQEKLLASIILPALNAVDRTTGSTLRKDHDTNKKFRNSLYAYLTVGFPFLNDLLNPGDVFVNPNRVDTRLMSEWAIQRHEELQLEFQQPVFRGPVGASPIAPKSTRTITETEQLTFEQERLRRDTRLQRQTQSQSTVSSSRFQRALDNLTEFGIADAAAFSNDATLLSTLNEERRASIESVVREISQENETRSSHRKTVSTGRSEQYSTEGKDPKLSTTELTYHVVSAVKAKSLLRDVSLVWCPRIPSPFMLLHSLIADYEAQEKAAYLAQHYVPAPIKPADSTSLHEEIFEVQIDGDDPINTKKFSRRFEFTKRSFIDLDGIRAKHRNGTGDDFDWDERWNWDDLENASARVQNLSLSADGRTLSGTAVLETTDPEYFNRSFVTISVPIKTYTDEAIAAFAAYDQSLSELTFKQEAVRSRAAQYARLKRQELIERYEDEISLKQEAYRNLIRIVFQGLSSNRRHYNEEVISRCINWNESVINFDSQPIDQLVFFDYAPDHFVNCPRIQFFLPIHPSAEDLFFDTLLESELSYHNSGTRAARDGVENWRERIADFRENDPGKLILDEFDTEIVLGQHLEAVLSKFEFATE